MQAPKAYADVLAEGTAGEREDTVYPFVVG